jgi:hypothetical protein
VLQRGGRNVQRIEGCHQFLAVNPSPIPGSPRAHHR